MFYNLRIEFFRFLLSFKQSLPSLSYCYWLIKSQFDSVFRSYVVKIAVSEFIQCVEVRTQLFLHPRFLWWSVNQRNQCMVKYFYYSVVVLLAWEHR